MEKAGPREGQPWEVGLVILPPPPASVLCFSAIKQAISAPHAHLTTACTKAMGPACFRVGTLGLRLLSGAEKPLRCCSRLLTKAASFQVLPSVCRNCPVWLVCSVEDLNLGQRFATELCSQPLPLHPNPGLFKAVNCPQCCWLTLYLREAFNLGILLSQPPK